jgi:hypothetical protein
VDVDIVNADTLRPNGNGIQSASGDAARQIWLTQ